VIGHLSETSGKPITDELVEELARKAEEGFDVEEIIRRRGGRPSLTLRSRHGCSTRAGGRIQTRGSEFDVVVERLPVWERPCAEDSPLVEIVRS